MQSKRRVKVERRWAALALGVVGVVSSAPGAAQTLAPVDATTSSATDQQLGDIVVTANRKEESQHNVATSVGVLSGTPLLALNSANQDVRVLAFKIPSLNVESSNGRTFPRFYIRGYGNTDYSSLASQPVSLVYDEVVQENPNLKGFPIFDVDDVQVFRGPQGTLFGRNAPAGVVSVRSAKPVLGESSGSISLSEGTYNTASIQAVLNVPISSDMAFRISSQEQHRDNWVKDEFNGTSLDGYDDVAARAQLLYQPSNDFSVLLNVHGRYLDAHNTLYYANSIKPGSNQLIDGFDPAKVYTDGRNTQQYRGAGANLRISWNLGNATLYSVSAWEGLFKYFSIGDVDGGYGANYDPPSGPGDIPFPVTVSNAINSLNQFTQEFRLQSNGASAFGWLVGLYYFNERVVEDTVDWDATGLIPLDDLKAKQVNNAAAIFASLTYRLSDRLQVRVGGRYTYDHKNFTVLNVANLVVATPAASATANNVSWDASGTFALTPSINLYAKVATGFRAPSFGTPTAYNGLQVAKSETNTSYEAGMKSYLFGRRVSLDLDGFYYEVRNQQLTVVGGANNGTELLNARKTIGYGAEGDLRWKVDSNLNLAISGSLNFTRIEDPTLQQAVCFSCTVTDPLTPTGNALIDGNPSPQVAKYVVDASLDYTRPIGVTTVAFFYGDLSYRSKVNFFLYESKEFTGPALLDLGLRAGLRWGEGKYEAAVFCRNCTNRIVAIGGIDFENLAAYVNDPRIVGMQLSARF